jgi:hypothetical protein
LLERGIAKFRCSFPATKSVLEAQQNLLAIPAVPTTMHSAAKAGAIVD